MPAWTSLAQGEAGLCESTGSWIVYKRDLWKICLYFWLRAKSQCCSTNAARGAHWHSLALLVHQLATYPEWPHGNSRRCSYLTAHAGHVHCWRWQQELWSLSQWRFWFQQKKSALGDSTEQERQRNSHGLPGANKKQAADWRTIHNICKHKPSSTDKNLHSALQIYLHTSIHSHTQLIKTGTYTKVHKMRAESKINSSMEESKKFIFTHAKVKLNMFLIYPLI